MVEENYESTVNLRTGGELPPSKTEREANKPLVAVAYLAKREYSAHLRLLRFQGPRMAMKLKIALYQQYRYTSVLTMEPAPP